MANSTENPATHVLLALLVEVGGLFVVITLAGLDDSIANVMLVFMVGLLLLFMVMNASKFQDMANVVLNAEKGA